MRCREADKFAGRDDLSLLPELRKMPAISCDQVIRTGFVGAFQKYVVVRVTAHVQAARPGNDVTVVLDELQQLQAKPFTNTQFPA
jgi:hypothetical protein